MAKNVTVMQRIKAGRTYPLIRVVFSRNGKPKIDPRATSFYLRYTLDGKRKCDAVGSDIDAVLARKIEIESKLRTGASVGINPTLVAPNLTTLTGAANQYFENLAASGLDIKTIHTYRVAVCDFVKSCSKTPDGHVVEVSGGAALFDGGKGEIRPIALVLTRCFAGIL